MKRGVVFTPTNSGSNFGRRLPLKTHFTALVAYDNRRGISKSGTIPWNLPADRSFFRFVTDELPVIMGSKTFQTIKMPLMHREIIVLSRRAARKNVRGVGIFPSPRAVQRHIQAKSDVIVAGGQDIYELYIDAIETIIATELEGDFGCDRFFPEIDLSKWQSELLYVNYGDDFHKSAFKVVRYDRKN